MEFPIPISNVGRWVRARRKILDSPLAAEDGSARRGDLGMVEDEADGYLFVGFGRGAIIVDYDEVAFVIPS